MKLSCLSFYSRIFLFYQFSNVLIDHITHFTLSLIKLSYILLFVELDNMMMYKGVLYKFTPPGEEDLGRHPDHAAGHDGAGGLRRVRELHPQPVLRVGQVQRVGRILEQAQSGQATGQPARDGALLLQRERKSRASCSGYKKHRIMFCYCFEDPFTPISSYYTGKLVMSRCQCNFDQ